VAGEYTLSGSDDLCLKPNLAGPLSGLRYGLLPVAGSPSIDTGDPVACPDVDLLGNSRPTDGDGDSRPICDRGAYEIP